MTTSANLDRLRVEVEEQEKLKEVATTLQNVLTSPLRLANVPRQNVSSALAEPQDVAAVALCHSSSPYRMMFLNPHVVGECESIKTIDLGQLQSDYDRVIPYEEWANTYELEECLGCETGVDYIGAHLDECGKYNIYCCTRAAETERNILNKSDN